MKIYFDQNSWDKIFDSYAAIEFIKKIKSNNINIFLGLESIYEFGRLFINDIHYCDKIRNIFSYLYKLSDFLQYLKEPNELIENDIEYAFSGGKVLPTLNLLDIVATKQEIFKISQGNFKEAKKFVDEREKKIKLDSNRFIENLKDINPDTKQEIEYEDYKDNWQIRRTLLKNSRYKVKTEYLSDEKLFGEPEKYPFLNTWINEQLYINFATFSKAAKPKNYTSDFRHLICANATGHFVTSDKQLLNVGKKVCPFINYLTWEDFTLS